MCAWDHVESFGEDVLFVDLSMIKLNRLPGWRCERASDEDGRSGARTLIRDSDSDFDGRIGHVGKTIQVVKGSKVQRMLVG